MSDKKVIVKTKKFMNNRLFKRKQFVVEIIHPARVCPTKDQVAEKLIEKYKVKDPKTVFLYGFKAKFGGGRTIGFGLIYDTQEDAKSIEPKYRLIRSGMAKKVEKSRQNMKQRKNRLKRLRGKKKAELRKK